MTLRTRLFLLTAAINVLVATLLVVFVASWSRPAITDQLGQHLRDTTIDLGLRLMETAPDVPQLREIMAEVDTSPDQRIGAISSRDLVPIGSDIERMQHWVEDLARTPRRPTYNQPVPRCYHDPNGDYACLTTITDVAGAVWVIEGTIPVQRIDYHERYRWVTLVAMWAGIVAATLAISGLVATRIARPITRAISAAERLGAGDLVVQTPPNGPREVVSLGVALNHLSNRIGRLLEGERERAASLSHQLRTPLTVLRLEIDRLSESKTERGDELERLRSAAAGIEEGLDEILRQSRSTREDGVATESEVVSLLHEHLDYWSDVAEIQHRTITRSIPKAPLHAAISSDDLAVAVDTIISNVFRHTPPGVGFGVKVSTTRTHLTIRVTDEGGQISTDETSFPSTGMGLKIATDLIESAGGTLSADPTAPGGYTVTIDLRRIRHSGQ